MWFLWPPSTAIHETLAREVDVIRVHSYLEIILKRTALGNPLGLQSGGIVREWRSESPQYRFHQRFFFEHGSQNGVRGILYYLGMGFIRSTTTGGEIVPDARELCELLRKLTD
jgi:hypothetical protein